MVAFRRRRNLFYIITLTKRLLDNAGKVICIELDTRMIEILNDRFKFYDNFEVINQDVLKVDLNEIIKENNCIMDGRDIGTVVLPNATVKIYLTASAEDRAKRRYDELILKGQEVTFKDVYDDMVKRDYNDMNRDIAPLKQADDAVVADTTGFEPEQSLELLLKIVREGMK